MVSIDDEKLIFYHKDGIIKKVKIPEYGSVNFVIQNGLIVLVEKTEKIK